MPEDFEEDGADVSDHMSDNEDEAENSARDDDRMDEYHEAGGLVEVKKKYDPKDPSRPRRKKARRACYACQRAHLTCGDERPCKRCVKRGLAEACQDGVRKKAKYLHDAPPEALRPVLGPNYNPAPTQTRPNASRHNSFQSDPVTTMTPQQSTYYSQRSQGATMPFPGYPTTSSSSMPLPDAMPFQSPVAATFQANANSMQPSMNNILPSTSMDLNALFDPSNPSLYNFDLEGLNFGSQYAGWEFGILNKMGLGAETPPLEASLTHTPTTEANYATVFSNGPNFDNKALIGGDFAEADISSNLYSHGNLQHGLPHAFAIAAGPTSLASPSTETTASPQAMANASTSPQASGMVGIVPAPPVSRSRAKHQLQPTQSILGKRQRDSASIYASVKEPYPYTTGFHNMVAVLRNRLPGNKLLKIARALGEIRPSFIACTKDLTREDLIFMEKCFQRTLVEFDDFLQHCCAPTIVCRRSGEVAAVNKEFTALTGWTKDVLLGRDPNYNISTRGSSTGSPVQDSEAPLRNRPAMQDTGGGRDQPIFLAELLDDDSIVDFYRDFAQLAFEDSRGKVQRSGRLMKYQTEDGLGHQGSSQKDGRTGMLSNRIKKIDSGRGVSRIERDGKVNCTYCWTIKRDVFDIPMMIIINFLPRYQSNQEPHQLAV